ncbi:class I SAM-dependent methyltransferase [Mucilaginibacter sp. KACC 22063]|uniref:class I SAM-dependent methyltransferase n=1 Tax=Mucilaginibacter sp. KACC 22063 TaxID=3025666 RepID=UPI0023669ADD|nr:methyltransferase domain-containing protein [Mucilaginibacter sp. KACC 22063]WDF55788.1 methyltransferase domain-containing protein [Mucilaginibacter sp. KACC 22063]
MTSPSFRNHHAAVSGNVLPPSQTLLEGLKHVTAPATAVDLGCGAGTDARHLASQGWKVLAIDADQGALDGIKTDNTLKTSCQRFESLVLPSVQLVNASFALPFCNPVYFGDCWLNITRALESNGVFCGHFFGIRDSWATRIDMTSHTAEQLKELFAGFELLWQSETEKDGKTLGSAAKHWHVYHIVARKC